MSLVGTSLRLLSSQIVGKRILRTCVPPPTSPSFFLPTRYKSTKKSAAGKKGSKAPQSFGDLLEELEDEELDKEDEYPDVQKQSVFKGTPAGEFIYNYHGAAKKTIAKAKGHRSKQQSAHKAIADYYDVFTMIRIEEYWSELQDIQNQLQEYFAHHLTIRSANSLDNLPINFEGDVYPLHELASISKKDAKRLIIDCSSFPTVAPSVNKAISESNMNLSPQVDGTTLYVPIPKVTREYREKLVKGAKASFVKAKEDFRKVQNKYISQAQNFSMSPECKLPKDKQHVVEEIIRSISGDFALRSEELLKIKQQEVLGK